MIKEDKSKIVMSMTIIITVLSFLSSIYSIFEKNVYQELLAAGKISPTILAGSIAQDCITILTAVVVFILAMLYKRMRNTKVFVLIIGSLGYFLYAYGLYAMQGMYTSLYIVYLLIFGLSIYGIIFSFISIDYTKLGGIKLTKKVELPIIIFLLLILMFLGPAWIGGILQSIQTHTPSETYGVYILDLCVVFPAFAITIIGLIKKQKFAKLLAGIMLTKGFTVCLSWSFAEWFVTFYMNNPVNMPMALTSTTLMIVSFILLVAYLMNLKIGE